MKKILFSVLLVLVLVLVMVSPVMAAPPEGKGASRGEAVDPNYSELGMIKYLGNPAGYHFWFTMSADLAHYEMGHSYHNVYQLTVDDPDEWSGVAIIPDREPYNLVGHPVGTQVYYKIFDTATGTQIYP